MTFVNATLKKEECCSDAVADDASDNAVFEAFFLFLCHHTIPLVSSLKAKLRHATGLLAANKGMGITGRNLPLFYNAEKFPVNGLDNGGQVDAFLTA